MRLLVAVYAMVFVAGLCGSAWAVDELPHDAPERVRKCLQETEPGPLKACVQDLAKWASFLDNLNGLERKLVAACLTDKSGDELKDCLKRFVSGARERLSTKVVLHQVELTRAKQRFID